MIPAKLLISTAVVLLAACTTQDEKIVHELENLPGVTCDINNAGDETNCHPDSLKATRGS